MEYRPDTPIELVTTPLAAPARHALAPLGLDTLSDLARFRRRDIAGLHGIGPSALAQLEAALAAAGLRFRPD